MVFGSNLVARNLQSARNIAMRGEGSHVLKKTVSRDCKTVHLHYLQLSTLDIEARTMDDLSQAQVTWEPSIGAGCFGQTRNESSSKPL